MSAVVHSPPSPGPNSLLPHLAFLDARDDMGGGGPPPLTPLSHKKGRGGVNSPPSPLFLFRRKLGWEAEASAAEQLKPCLLEKRARERIGGLELIENMSAETKYRTAL